MSDKATELVNEFSQRVADNLLPDYSIQSKLRRVAARDALLTYIERIERERDEARTNAEWLRGCSDTHANQMRAKDADIAELKEENVRLRKAGDDLAGDYREVRRYGCAGAERGAWDADTIGYFFWSQWQAAKKP